MQCSVNHLAHEKSSKVEMGLSFQGVIVIVNASPFFLKYSK